MRTFLFVLISIFTLGVVLPSCSSKKQTAISTENYTPSRVLIISYKNKSILNSLKKDIKSYGATIVYDYNNFNSIAISIPEEKSISKSISHFKSIKGVVGVERDQMMELN